MKIMLYCQHVLGIGHFFRSMEIARAFHRHDVLFVEGGDPLGGFTPPPHVQRAFLPPLMMDSEFTRFEIQEEQLDAVKQRRKDLLMDLFKTFRPDVLLIELFPFGRKRFQFELMPVLEMIRQGATPVRVICSLRDILVEKDDQAGYEQRVLHSLNNYFHLLLVHSDPRLAPLEESFARVNGIRIPLFYTGFVVKETPPRRATESRIKQIVASSGGGKVGADLLAAVIEAVRQLGDSDIRLRIFIGPFMAERDQDLLLGLASRDPRTSVHPFSLDFTDELLQASLSISMAGYNTCMDILATGVRGLVYPFQQNREQTMRAKKLESLNLLRVLDTLDPGRVASVIQEALDKPPSPPALLPDLCGAWNTVLLVEKYCSTH